MIGAILTSIFLAFRPLPATPAALMVPFLLVLLVLVSWVSMRQHDRGLCERCMSAMPLNPSAAAERCRRRFAVTHLGSDRRLVAAYLLLLVFANVLLLPASGVFHTAGQYLWAAVQSTLIYLVMCYTTHRRLQPWCPECQGGGPGDREWSADPTPSGSSYR